MQDAKNKPYVYIIGWPDLHRYYIGVRYAASCVVGDIWKTYFTSSKIVHAFAERFGPPPYIEVVGVFDTGEEAFQAEQALLVQGQVSEKTMFLNRGTWRCIGKANGPGAKKKWTDPVYRSTITEAVRKSWKDNEQRRLKARQTASENFSGPRYGQDYPTLTFQGITKTVREWAEVVPVTAHQLLVRKNQGWSDTDCLLRPVRPRRKAGQNG